MSRRYVKTMFLFYVMSSSKTFRGLTEEFSVLKRPMTRSVVAKFKPEDLIAQHGRLKKIKREKETGMSAVLLLL